MSLVYRVSRDAALPFANKVPQINSQMEGRMARRLNILRKYLPYQANIMQLMKGANRLKITRVCREMRPRRKPHVCDRSGGDSPIPIVAKAVRMCRTLLSAFPQIAKTSIIS